jgi:hypothetical protein
MNNEVPKNLKAWLEDIKIGSTQEDVQRLETNIQLLYDKGLSKLNKRLFSQTKRFHFLSTLTEHNFTANLLKIKSDIQIHQIRYEPNDTGSNKTPDLNVHIDDVNYWIQLNDSHN